MPGSRVPGPLADASEMAFAVRVSWRSDIPLFAQHEDRRPMSKRVSESGWSVAVMSAVFGVDEETLKNWLYPQQSVDAAVYLNKRVEDYRSPT